MCVSGVCVCVRAFLCAGEHVALCDPGRAGADPVIMADSEYPEWLFKLLEPRVSFRPLPCPSLSAARQRRLRLLLGALRPRDERVAPRAPQYTCAREGGLGGPTHPELTHTHPCHVPTAHAPGA